MARRRKYRRNPSGKDILMFAGIAVGGYLLYEHMKPKPAIAVAPAPGGLVPIAQGIPASIWGNTIGGAVDAIAKLFGSSSTPTPTPGTTGPASAMSSAISSLFPGGTPTTPVLSPNAGGGLSGLGSLG